MLCSSAAAEPIRFTVPVQCSAEGKTIDLEPGRYLPEESWVELDAEMVALQDDVTRLEAENASLLESSSGGDWRLVLAGTVVGMAVGAYALSRWGEPP